MKNDYITPEAIRDAYQHHFEKYAQHIDAHGWLQDEPIGQDEHMSVWVLCNCTREQIGGKTMWRPVSLNK